MTRWSAICYNATMEKVVRAYDPHQEAEAADLEYHRKLTPEQRLRILFQIIADHEGGTDASKGRVQKVVRIIDRGQNTESVLRSIQAMSHCHQIDNCA